MSYESIALNSRAKCHSDDSPVSLNADQKAIVCDGIRQAVDVMRYVHELAAKDTLTVSARSNGIGLAYSYLDRAADAAGFASDREDEHKATQKVLRAANERIRELENQLAQSVTGEALAQAVKKTCDSIWPAWKKAGFCHATEISLGSRYLSATLRCDADDGLFTHSDTPETDKQTADVAKARLEEAGIQFTGDGRRHEDRRALDTDSNKAAIAQVILGIWPQAKITRWESSYLNFGETSGFVIRGVEVLIPIESLIGEGETS